MRGRKTLVAGFEYFKNYCTFKFQKIVNAYMHVVYFSQILEKAFYFWRTSDWNGK
jgi:hypothetical protein